ncbi:MAG: TPM domain-containing protein [Phaeodactylibacter sp.]|nr:TPM domain-containing protein [Phaeodactylibacter sp.]MCB9300685.1 TPM domain-containing protein [Lewinellaceae bacterium]HQU60703.1 TPM domain-containing protein [Saprospiraceae bacterium]
MIKFFKPEEEERIIEAIRKAELNTSGEVRVHLEANCKGEIVREAVRTFRRLGMHKTKARNAVLIFLAPERREFAIIGDKGINEQLPENFWQEERDLMLEHFRQGAFAKGVCEAIGQVGEKLKVFFPYQQDDTNELPDDISYS